MEQPLDYDNCAQFLARLDADALHANRNGSPESPTGDAFDIRNSASPPGLSSGSATSHSPESLRFDWDPSDTYPSDTSAFFTDINETAGIITDGTPWDPLIIRDQQESGVSSMSDYIKIETENSPTGYYPEPTGPQGTISPGNSLLDPAAPTALEDGYTFPKENDGFFDFNTYSGQSDTGQNPSDFSPMTWRPETQAGDDFQSQNPNWQQQQQQQAQQQAQQRQQRQRQQLLQQLQQLPPIPQQQQTAQQTAQRPSPLRKSVSPTYSHSASSPESHGESNSDDGAPPAPRTKKRKTSSEDTSAGDSQQAPATSGRKQPKKTAHNMIEKRYRTNLNDKIAALRDSVPSLRVMAGTARLGEDDEEEDLGGLAPAHKLNKATVLAKATEYIRHLEKRNKRLQDENDQLRNRLHAFEKLAAMGGNMGLHPQQGPHGGRGGQAGGPGGGGLMSRLMVGSLAGLMVANGLQSNENGSKQLGGVPVEWIGFVSPTSNNHMFWLVAKLLLLITAVGYVISPSFFDAKEPTENTKISNNTNISSAPSLASPLKDRSHAWLTAIQTVWVPRHSVALELVALGLKSVKLSLRRLVGWEKYRMITSMTEEQELARIKSWTIALDAQLAGGDDSVNRSRLLLTLLASWTLPSTPARLMLNALHIHVLCFDDKAFHGFTKKFSNYYWLEARKAQEKAAADNDTEQLPENLAQLLQLDSSVVFDNLVVQKAYTLAYNRDMGYDGMDEGMDSVVKDVSIRSPLDALAAWYSSLLLQRVLVASLKAKPSPSLHDRIKADLDTALKVAPPTCAAQIRALTANAVFANENGEKFLSEATKIFEEDFRSHEQELNQQPSTPRISMTPINSAVTTTIDIRIALRCGMALALMKKGSRDQATRLFSDLDWKKQADKNGLGLLGFVAAWKTLTTFVSLDADWANDAGESVDGAAAMLRIWIGDKKIPKFGISRGSCKHVIDFCNSLQRKLAGLGGDGDDGYVSGGTDVKQGPRAVTKV